MGQAEGHYQPKKVRGEGIIDGSYSSGDNLDGIREAVFGTLSAGDSVRMLHEAPLSQTFQIQETLQSRLVMPCL